MESCPVAMAMKRRQLFREEIDLRLCENKREFCVYSLAVGTEIPAGCTPIFDFSSCLSRYMSSSARRRTSSIE
jgi:hypothetical protein